MKRLYLEKLPPIAVFHTDSKYILADGFHRWAAAVRKGWEYIEAEVKEGSLEEASEFSITANLKHGKPLTSYEYAQALRRLRFLHPDWSHKRLSEVLSRSQRWVWDVLAADRVEELVPGTKLGMRTKTEISRAPKHLWAQISQAAQEQEWKRDETKEKVQRIKAEPERIQEILYPAHMPTPTEEELREKFGILIESK